jgi:quinol monooxygenase YgiN
VFAEQARAALNALRARPGFVRGSAGRSTDEGDLWVIVTEWESVGAFRRALSSFEVKVDAVPLLATAIDEASAFETLLVASAQQLVQRSSDRATDADLAGPDRG